MGKRQRKLGRAGKGGDPPASSTTDYRDEEGNVLTLRDELTAGDRAPGRGPRRQAGRVIAEDRWQRKVELLFERLAVRWEIAGLPLEGQKELLGRYRMASAATSGCAVRDVLAEHLRDALSGGSSSSRAGSRSRRR